MNLTESWNHAVELELQGRQEAQSLPGWAVGDVLSSMPRCLPGKVEWEIELCVISVEMLGEAMCLYDGTQWCIVCGEVEGSNIRSLGNPSDQFMCFGYLPSPGHPERPTSEIGFKPAKWNPSDVQWWEGGQEDLMIDSVESGRQIQQNEDWWFGISAVSVELPLLKPDWLSSSLLFCERNNETWLKTTHSSVLAMNGRRETGL